MFPAFRNTLYQSPRAVLATISFKEKKEEGKKKREQANKRGEKMLNSNLGVFNGKQNNTAGGNICHLSLRQRREDLMQVRWSQQGASLTGTR